MAWQTEDVSFEAFDALASASDDLGPV